MTWHFLRYIGALGLAVLAGTEMLLDYLGTSTATSFSPTTCNTNWSQVSSPNTTGPNLLLGVAGAAPANVWAVGYSGLDGSHRTEALHWNGTAWSLVATPNGGAGNNVFSGVAVVSANDVWAAGHFDPPNAGLSQTLIDHWNGTAWTLDPDSVAGTLRGITTLAADNVWAVGYDGDLGSYHTLIRHWDGSTWTTVPSPNGGAGDNSLISVAGSSPTDLWAVGYRITGTTRQTLILHWNGTIWTLDPNTSAGSLESVTSRSSNDVWAVGAVGQPQTTLTRHWDGSAWTTIPSPNGGSGDNYLLGVTSLTGSDVWAVGANQPSSGPAQPLLEHWNGQTWALELPPTAGVLWGITGTTTQELWAVGYTGNADAYQTLIVHNPVQCTTVTPTSTPTVTPTNTLTATPTNTLTATTTTTSTNTPTAVLTATATLPPTVPATMTALPATGTATLPPTVPATATALQATGTPSATPTFCVPREFSDVPPEYWAAGYIRWLYCRGAITGYSDGTFRPEGTLTRGQTTKIVLLSAGITPVIPPGAPHFRDVPPTNVFYPFIETAYARGVLTGYSDGTFQPSAAITRAQIAKIVIGVSGLPLAQPATATFADVPPGSTFYAFIETAVTHGIVSGYDCGVGMSEPCDAARRPYYRPSANATRAQLSKVTFLAFGLPVR